MKKYILVFLFCAAPLITHADVIINEIAWMGSNGSQYCEWFELQNTDDNEVDITDWSLTIGTTKKYFSPATLTQVAGTVIEPHGFYTISGNTASCKSYYDTFASARLSSLSFPDTGTTLVLRDSQGTIVQQIQQAALPWSELKGQNGDHSDTLQWTGVDWLLLAPTPNEPTPLPETSTVVANGTGTRTVVTTAWNTSSIRALSLHAPRTAFVGVPIQFSSVTSPRDARKFKAHTWNFGDLTTSTNSEPTHTYTHPGTYLIHLNVENGTHADDIVLTQRITVLPSPLTLSQSPEGTVLTNNSPEDVDISSFRIVARTNYTIPQDTTLLAGASLTLPNTSGAPVALVYSPDGSLLASTRAAYTTAVAPIDPHVTVNPLTEEEEEAPTETQQATDTTLTKDAPTPTTPEKKHTSSILGLGALILAGIAGIFMH